MPRARYLHEAQDPDRVLPKSGHTINLEEPEAFNRAVLDFLTTVDAGKWTRRNPASQTGSAVLPAETR